MSTDLPCACFRLRRAARQVSQLYDRALAPAQLSLNEYSILRHASAGPRTLGELAVSLGMDRSTLNRNLKPLLEAGWLQDRPGEDARQRVLGLTPLGRGRLRQAQPLWRRAQAQLQALHGEQATRALVAQLDALDVDLRGAPESP